jgi:hypothetical protein
MALTLTSPITGQAQTGLTSPTYSHVTDVAPDVNGKQVAVTSLGGTQTGVVAHSVSSPFTITFVRPKTYKFLGKPNPTTGLIGSVPRNSLKTITRKGVIPQVGQPTAVMVITTTMDIPAGADSADPTSIRAAISAHLGALVQQSSNVGDAAVQGVI